MKKILSILLCMAMLLGFVPMGFVTDTYAADTTPTVYKSGELEDTAKNVTVSMEAVEADGDIAVTVKVKNNKSAQSPFLLANAIAVLYDETLVTPDAQKGMEFENVLGDSVPCGMDFVGFNPAKHSITLGASAAVEQSGKAFLYVDSEENGRLNRDRSSGTGFAESDFIFYFKPSEAVAKNGGDVVFTLGQGKTSGNVDTLTLSYAQLTLDGNSLYPSEEIFVNALSGPLTVTYKAPVPPISAVKISGNLTTPTKGGTDTSNLTADSANVDVKVAWEPALGADNKFAANTEYKATVTVSPKEGASFSAGATCTYEGTSALSFTKIGTGFTATKTFEKTDSKTLTGFEITTPATKLSGYAEGDTFDTTGMVTKATYDDGSTDDAFTGYEVIYGTGSTLAKGDESVTIQPTGMEAFARTVTIDKVGGKISEDKVTLDKTDFTYTGAAQAPTVTVTGLTKGTDYTVSIKKGNDSVEEAVDAGDYTVVVTGMGEYAGTVSKAFTIAKAAQTLELNPATPASFKFGKNSKLTIADLVNGEQGALTAEFDGEAHGITIVEGALVAPETWPGEENENTLTAKLKVTAAATANYNASAPLTVTVTLANKDVVSGQIVKKADAVTTAVYNGAEQDFEWAKLADGFEGTAALTYSYLDQDGNTITGKPKNAGTYTAVATYSDDERFGTNSESVTITKKPVTVSGITAAEKVYDGTTDATVSAENASFAGKVEGDELTITATGVFADKNAGKDKTVTLTLGELAGAAKDNYELAAEGNQNSATANINQKEVTLTWGETTKFVYNAQEQAPTVTLGGAVAGDDVKASVTGAKVAVGENYSAAVELTGSDKDNYAPPTEGATKTFAITKAPVTIKAIKAKWNETEKKAELYGAKIDGLQGSDQLDITYPAADTVSVAGVTTNGEGTVTVVRGTNKAVTVSTDAVFAIKDVDGAAASVVGNYELKSTDTTGITVDIPLENAKVGNVADTVAINAGDVNAKADQFATEDTTLINSVATSVTGVDIDNTSDKNGITEAVTKLASSETEIGKAVTDAKALPAFENIDTDAIVITVKPEVEVDITEIKDNGAGKVESFTVDVSAFYQMQASAPGVEATDVGERQNLQVDEPITLTIPVGTLFDGFSKAFVLHAHEDGKTYEYEAPITAGKITFEATHGLSEFTVSTSQSTIGIGDVVYDTLQEAVNAVSEGGVITIKSAMTASEAATVSKAISFTVAESEAGYFNGTITAGSGYQNTDETTSNGDVAGTYTFTKKSSSTGGSGGGGGVNATVSTSTTSNGTYTLSSTVAKAGDTVKLTPKPNEGYEVDAVKAVDKNGKELAVTKNADGTYSFVMPANALQPVKTEVTFKTVEEQKPDQTTTTFSDVVAGSFYEEAVKWAVEKGITTGKSATSFAPNDTCTRAEAVTFLYRAAGSPDVAVNTAFTDVAAGSYYEKAVAWAVANGITNGKDSQTTFKPGDTCTRAEIVTFLARYENAASAVSTQFSDVASGQWFAGAVGWAVNNGITNGTSATTFDPASNCTRAQIVTFLYRDFTK